MEQRFKSLDVFRGFTVAMMILVNTPGSWSHIYSPLGHAQWHGYTPTDLVFPFFLIAIGLSMSFSFQKHKNTESSGFYLKVTKRTILIFLIGIALAAYPFFNKDYSQLRLLGVLQRIALSYFLASIIIHNFRSAKKLLWISSISLIGYWLLFLIFGGPDPYSLLNNLPRKIDLLILGDARMWHGHGAAFDPEGFLSTITATISVISGYLIGLLMQKFTKMELVARLLLLANSLIILGYIWDLSFPINKALWTSSYVLVSTGIAGVVLGLLIYVLDIRKWQSWATAFEAFGRNPLVVYILSILWVKTYFIVHIGEQNMYGWLYTSFFKQIINPTFGSFLFALSHVFGCWLIAFVLYKRKIYIKL